MPKGCGVQLHLQPQAQGTNHNQFMLFMVIPLLFPGTGEQGVWARDTILANLLMRETWHLGKVSEQLQMDMMTESPILMKIGSLKLKKPSCEES